MITNPPIGRQASALIVQFQKNCSHHSGIGQTPYKAMFGVEPKIGLRSSVLPDEILNRLVTEEDLRNAYDERSQPSGTLFTISLLQRKNLII